MIDKSKQYRTRDGREVRIYATDGSLCGGTVHGAWKDPDGEMIKPDMIPDEAAEAAARAICETENGPCKFMPDECGCTYWLAHARASISAALSAWPGNIHYRGGWEPVINNHQRKPQLILPLPAENKNG